MPRRPTGQVIERVTAQGVVFALRFRAYGRRRYITLGTAADGWTRARAEAELVLNIAQVELGTWQEPTSRPTEPVIQDPTFHTFASEWLEARRPELRPATHQAYRTELVRHLLPFFARHRLSEITVAEVDRYREHKLRAAERYRQSLEAWHDIRETLPPENVPPKPDRTMVAASYVNATITRLGMILDVADERGLIDRNPVRVNPRRRKAKVSRARRAYLDRPDQIEALLSAAGRLDAKAREDRCLRRPLLATLIFGGLRISESLALRWRDVDLAGGRLRVGDADETKTDAGTRWVPIVPALHEELLARKGSVSKASPGSLVFATRTGKPLSRHNVLTRILGRARRLADDALQAAGLALLPERLTLQSLRHTYISLRVAIGDDPATIAADAGHADIAVTFRIYTHVMHLAQGDRERLRALVDGIEWTPTDAGGLPEIQDAPERA